MISRKNKLKPLNSIQQKYFKTSQKKFNQYQSIINDNIKSESLKKLSKKLTTKNFKEKRCKKMTQSKSISKKNKNSIGGAKKGKDKQIVHQEGAAGPASVEKAAPAAPEQVPVEGAEPPSAKVPVEEAESPPATPISATSSSLSTRIESPGLYPAIEENVPMEQPVVSEEQVIGSQKLVEKEINTSEISKRLTLIEQYLGIPLVKTGDDKGEAECQNVNLNPDHSNKFLEISDEHDVNAYKNIKNLDEVNKLSLSLTKMLSYIGGAREQNYSSQIQFNQNPNQTTNNKGLNSYDWVPVDKPYEGYKVPTNYNLLF